ncbi:DUF5667 domain-containing protein [Planobispora rosea]|nr:DUF5667 domain-containing protein [Planobispora rosea]
MATTPRPEFRDELRERLMSTAREAPLPAEEVPVPRRPRSRRRPRFPLLPQFLSAGLVVIMVATGMATYESVPGDILYPLKRAAENTLLRMSADDAERADRELRSASVRAREVEELLGSAAQGGSDLVGETLKEMEDTTRSAITSLTRVERRDAKTTGTIRRFVQEQRHQIEEMIPKMDEEDQRRASGYLDYIQGLMIAE